MQARKILLVEDERPIAENIVYALKAEHFAVKWVPTGRDALKALREEGADFIVLDINLPDMSGFDVCREARKISNKPILFLSARQDEIDRVVGLEIGGDDYLMKPFSLRELIARIRVILKRSEQVAVAPEAPPSKTKIPFEIDDKRNRISFFGEKLELSRYEFFILRTLIGRPGWVFSRDQLIDHTMGQMSAPFDRTIDAHIKSIRAKLRKIKSDVEAIETQRGFGYSLRENW